ncbi:Ig-like domain-containing protein [Lentilactobacillus hilgardii]|nr:Ig-like domain-containing protein [Lentilactobacillus hilgardii]MCV3739684.1 Ig-like domain-containing protein [Lentilactobacillus hilgardii]
MNRYVLSALVVPVALMGAVTAQAKTALLKATVNQAKSGTKVVSGKATRGAKIKISRAGVTYGVAKANKHGHFVMKLKRAVKGGWTYKVTVTKAGFKVKSDHFKVKRTKKPAKVAVPSETTPTKPASVSKPSAPVASSTPSAKPVVSTASPKTNANTNPRPNISAVDIEAYQINTEMASLNRQLDLAGFGQQRLATSLRTSLGNQIDQLQNRVNVFATRPGVNSATISSMNSELNTLRQKFYGLPNTFVLSGSHTVTQPAANPAQNVAKTEIPVSQQIADLKKEKDQLNAKAAELDIKIANKVQHAQNDEKKVIDRYVKEQTDLNLLKLAGQQGLDTGMSSDDLRDDFKKSENAFNKGMEEIQNSASNSLTPLFNQRETLRNKVTEDNVKIDGFQKDN